MKKLKWKSPLPFCFLPQIFWKKNYPLPNILKTLSSSLKKEVGRGRKLMCFHLKIYVILSNTFCVFLLGHIDAFWMFLLLPAVKSKTIKQKIGGEVCLLTWSLYSYSDRCKTFFTRYCFTALPLLYTSVKPRC